MTHWRYQKHWDREECFWTILFSWNCVWVLQVGETGAGYRWAVRDGGQEEEWRHSVAPIPPEKIQEIVAANREHDVEEVDYDIRALGGRDSAVGIGNKN